MPVIFPLGSVMEVQVIGAFYTQECMNVLHFVTLQADLTEVAIANELNLGWCNNLRQVYSVDWRWTRYTMRRIDSIPKGDYVTWPSSLLLGLGSAGTLPMQCASLWALKENAFITPAKGRVFHPAVPGTAWISGNWSNAYNQTHATAIANVHGRFKRGGTSGLLQWVIVTGLPDQVTVHDVDQVLFRRQPGTIRSRRPD